MVVIQASQDKKSLDVGANLFVGNLDPVCLSVDLSSMLGWSCISCFWSQFVLGKIWLPIWVQVGYKLLVMYACSFTLLMLCSWCHGRDGAGCGWEAVVWHIQCFWCHCHQSQGALSLFPHELIWECFKCGLFIIDLVNGDEFALPLSMMLWKHLNTVLGPMMGWASLDIRRAVTIY